MRKVGKWIARLLAGVFTVSVCTAPGFAEAADVRVVETGTPYLAADFEDGGFGDWTIASGAPEVVTEEDGKVLHYQQTGAAEPLSMQYGFAEQLTGSTLKK